MTLSSWFMFYVFRSPSMFTSPFFRRLFLPYLLVICARADHHNLVVLNSQKVKLHSRPLRIRTCLKDAHHCFHFSELLIFIFVYSRTRAFENSQLLSKDYSFCLIRCTTRQVSLSGDYGSAT